MAISASCSCICHERQSGRPTGHPCTHGHISAHHSHHLRSLPWRGAPGPAAYGPQVPTQGMFHTACSGSRRCLTLLRIHCSGCKQGLETRTHTHTLACACRSEHSAATRASGTPHPFCLPEAWFGRARLRSLAAAAHATLTAEAAGRSFALGLRPKQTRQQSLLRPRRWRAPVAGAACGARPSQALPAARALCRRCLWRAPSPASTRTAQHRAAAAGPPRGRRTLAPPPAHKPPPPPPPPRRRLAAAAPAPPWPGAARAAGRGSLPGRRAAAPAHELADVLAVVRERGLGHRAQRLLQLGQVRGRAALAQLRARARPRRPRGRPPAAAARGPSGIDYASPLFVTSYGRAPAPPRPPLRCAACSCHGTTPRRSRTCRRRGLQRRAPPHSCSHQVQGCAHRAQPGRARARRAGRRSRGAGGRMAGRACM